MSAHPQLAASPDEIHYWTQSDWWPVWLVLDLSNESARSLQATRVYLDVESSATDLQPFLQAQPWGFEAFQLHNRGWGRAENAVLDFAFGAEQPVSERFSLALGSAEVTLLDLANAYQKAGEREVMVWVQQPRAAGSMHPH
mgnify:CR=1 FL=1